MQTLYFDCSMGASGDMLMAALLELHPEPENFIKRLNDLQIPGVAIRANKNIKCGITGTQVTVSIYGVEEEGQTCENCGTGQTIPQKEKQGGQTWIPKHIPVIKEEGQTCSQEHSHSQKHHHNNMHDIHHIINHLDISPKICQDVLSVYSLIAKAESHAHGKPVEQIHFHEVGMMDALADILGVCLLIEELAPKNILASPVRVGYGQVRCAHGVLPVPAPATAYILQGIPVYSGSIEGELCTPTGAALLKYFVSDFQQMPILRISKIGYGMGGKNFGTANCLRTLLGETEEHSETICELRCNLDDMTPEAIAFAQEKLFEAGALDVMTSPIVMKKNRLATLLTCLCWPKERNTFIELLFRHTTTIGIRESLCNRYVLSRTEKTIQTEYGSLRIKHSSGWGSSREKAEYEDLIKIAQKSNHTFLEVSQSFRSEGKK